ncbi:ABC transporter permease subunit [Hydrogenophaga sp. 5NK40-0174]
MGAALLATANAAAWQALFAHPQFWSAFTLSLWTGLASTALAWLTCRWIMGQLFVHRSTSRLLYWLPPMLATPHAAFAIGLGLLIAPSGWLLRWASPWATGLDLPPPWPTTQDPWGLGLIASLALKETPFLMFASATELYREDRSRQWRAEHALAMSMGYGGEQAWHEVVWPQLARRLFWPLAAVLTYGLTVVDVALVIGPTSPPTLAALAWGWLRDASLATNAMGAAAAGAMSLVVALAALAASVWLRQGVGAPSGLRRNGDSRVSRPGWPMAALAIAYALALCVLAVQSAAGWWPFPEVWPQQWSSFAWNSVFDSRQTIWATLAFAGASTLISLLWCMAWLELAPGQWDRWARPLLYAPLAVPAVLWVIGLYDIVLRWQMEGHWLAVLLGHVLMVLPYVLLTLSPAYSGYDRRYAAVTAALGKPPWQHLLRVKWPLLRASLSSGAAVGFAVSVAQYLPTLYLGAGRHNTITTEAVALASGGQPALASAYAWLLFSIPVLGFAFATWWGRQRRFASAT